MRGAALAQDLRTRRGTPGTAAAVAVEPASGRDRPRPRLVLQRPGTADSRRHPRRSRALGARHALLHAAGVPRRRCRGSPYLARLAVSWSASDAMYEECQAPGQLGIQTEAG